MKNFIENLKREFDVFKAGKHEDYLFAPPTIDNAKVYGVTALYLTLASCNNGISNSYITLSNIRMDNIDSDYYSKVESLNVVTEISISDNILLKRKDVEAFCPGFNFEQPRARDLDYLKELINSHKIHGHPASSSLRKIEGLVVSLPIKNFIYDKQECISSSYLINLKQQPKQYIKFSSEASDYAETIRQEVMHPLLREMALLNNSIAENEYIDISGFKALSGLNGIVNINGDAYKILDIIKNNTPSKNIKL